MTHTPRRNPSPSSLENLLRSGGGRFAVVVAIGVALPFGCVGNREFNSEPEDYLRVARTPGGLPYAVSVVEFDDQGEPWNLEQLDAVVELIRTLNAESPHGIILHQFIHGWKSNASRDQQSGQRLAWFEGEIERLAGYSEAASTRDGAPARPVVGLFIGWRGRTYSLPVLIDASFWNRRVAAHRVASIGLIEVLQRTLRAADENPDSKCFLLGHSMGGLILEKTVGQAVMGEILEVERDRCLAAHRLRSRRLGEPVHRGPLHQTAHRCAQEIARQTGPRGRCRSSAVRPMGP